MYHRVTILLWLSDRTHNYTLQSVNAPTCLYNSFELSDYNKNIYELNYTARPHVASGTCRPKNNIGEVYYAPPIWRHGTSTWYTQISCTNVLILYLQLRTQLLLKIFTDFTPHELLNFKSKMMIECLYIRNVFIRFNFINHL